jgi:hypothetical protein
MNSSMTMLDRATEAVVKAHDDEIRAYLAGEIEANVWRPEVYARAALSAALGAVLEDTRGEAHAALSDIRAELSHVATANWEYIERRFADVLDRPRDEV